MQVLFVVGYWYICKWPSNNKNNLVGSKYTAAYCDIIYDQVFGEFWYFRSQYELRIVLKYQSENPKKCQIDNRMTSSITPFIPYKTTAT